MSCGTSTELCNQETRKQGSFACFSQDRHLPIGAKLNDFRMVASSKSPSWMKGSYTVQEEFENIYTTDTRFQTHRSDGRTSALFSLNVVGDEINMIGILVRDHLLRNNKIKIDKKEIDQDEFFKASSMNHHDFRKYAMDKFPKLARDKHREIYIDQLKRFYDYGQELLDEMEVNDFVQKEFPTEKGYAYSILDFYGFSKQGDVKTLEDGSTLTKEGKTVKREIESKKFDNIPFSIGKRIVFAGKDITMYKTRSLLTIKSALERKDLDSIKKTFPKISKQISIDKLPELEMILNKMIHHGKIQEDFLKEYSGN